jgi:hypothetical protein
MLQFAALLLWMSLLYVGALCFSGFLPTTVRSTNDMMSVTNTTPVVSTAGPTPVVGADDRGQPRPNHQAMNPACMPQQVTFWATITNIGSHQNTLEDANFKTLLCS